MNTTIESVYGVWRVCAITGEDTKEFIGFYEGYLDYVAFVLGRDFDLLQMEPIKVTKIQEVFNHTTLPIEVNVILESESKSSLEYILKKRNVTVETGADPSVFTIRRVLSPEEELELMIRNAVPDENKAIGILSKMKQVYRT